MENLTVQNVFDTMCHDLQMTWRYGVEYGDRLISRESRPENRPRLIGPMTPGISQRVQLVGPTEIRLLENTEFTKSAQTTMLQSCDLLIITDALEPPLSLRQLATFQHIPLLISQCSFNDCLNKLRYRLTQYLADRSVIHGVMMDVLGTGVLITGKSGVGKSELALELVSRGHILVADDAPEFRRIAPETIEGSCPPLLQDFLEVRGLGILNIARMYGDAHTRRRKILKFIVELREMHSSELNSSLDRTQQPDSERDILGVKIRQRLLPVAPGRNLAVLVEATVRNHILISTGYNAAKDLVSKHNSQLESS